MAEFMTSETALRSAAFLLAFLLFAGLEALFPKRARTLPRLQRWRTNVGMLALASLLVRGLVLIAPLLALSAAAALAAELGWGVLNQVALPMALEVAVAVIALDLAVWFQHLLSHKVPVLWRIHRVHHADRDLDVTSALRFHPAEIALSAAYKLAIVLLLGPSVLAAILFEIVLNACAMFNHANLALPGRFDRVLRWLLVTPDVHRVHHSIRREEQDSNYGFCLSVWDRIFRTYADQPAAGQAGMTLGLADRQSAPTQALVWSLLFPFETGPAGRADPQAGKLS